jgi:hypothetical protein
MLKSLPHPLAGATKAQPHHRGSAGSLCHLPRAEGGHQHLRTVDASVNPQANGGELR